jgi:hypothetical protein
MPGPVGTPMTNQATINTMKASLPMQANFMVFFFA